MVGLIMAQRDQGAAHTIGYRVAARTDQRGLDSGAGQDTEVQKAASLCAMTRRRDTGDYRRLSWLEGVETLGGLVQDRAMPWLAMLLSVLVALGGLRVAQRTRCRDLGRQVVVAEPAEDREALTYLVACAGFERDLVDVDIGLHQAAGSASIDAGVCTAVATDYDGDARPVGGGCDGCGLVGGWINPQGKLAREVLPRFDAATLACFQEYTQGSLAFMLQPFSSASSPDH